MFGLIHECTRQLIIAHFGEEMWKEILDRAGFEYGKENNVNFHYSDEQTYAIIDSACVFTKMTKDQIWELFGGFFVQYTMDGGWDKMFRSLSPNLKGFLNNLDSLHYFIDHVVYKANLRGPSFRCEDGGDDSIILHYFSSRSGLYPIVKGIIREIAKRLYSQDVTITLTGRTQRSVQLATGERVEEHVTFRIKLQGILGPSSPNSLAMANYATSAIADGQQTHNHQADGDQAGRTLQVMSNDFCHILPYHVIMDRDCKLVAYGNALCNHVSADLLQIGTPIVRIFEICRPQIPLDFENVCNFINGVFILQVRTSPLSVNRSSKHSGSDSANMNRSNEDLQIIHLKLKGQMMKVNDDQLIYVCSPYVTNVAELMQYDLRLSSIPIHDTTRDLVLINQQRLNDVETNVQLEANNEQLEKLAKDLAEEQTTADALLREVLPSTVATQLMGGCNVDPQEYAEATIMFTDIPAFQTIVPSCKPSEVVSVLNNLFLKFDLLIATHNVYKVETVGETYMTISGVPQFDESHCEKICHVALGMIWEGRTVLDPLNQNPLLVRCGINSGKVVAGVVGQKMPRYCIFGDTVSTAALMESHSPPGRIHCNKSSFEIAQKTGRFEFVSRGHINVKGKGLMETFYLKKSNKKAIWDIIQRPRDENLNSIDGYSELFDDIESELKSSINPISKSCSIS